jgi:hypothetical protein
LLGTSCTVVNSYAVLAPYSAAADSTSCFRQCQLLRAGGTNTYLACVRNCPGTAVTDHEACDAIPVPANYQCTTEHNKSFSLGGTIIAIALGTLALFVLAAAADSGHKTQ